MVQARTEVKVYPANDDYGNDIDHTTNVLVGSETVGEINYSKDVDVFKFIPVESGRVYNGNYWNH